MRVAPRGTQIPASLPQEQRAAPQLRGLVINRITEM